MDDNWEIEMESIEDFRDEIKWTSRSFYALQNTVVTNETSQYS